MAVIKTRSAAERRMSQFFRDWDKSTSAARINPETKQVWDSIAEVPEEERSQVIPLKAWFYREMRRLGGNIEEAFQNYCDLVKQVTGKSFVQLYLKYGADKDEAMKRWKAQFFGGQSVPKELHEYLTVQQSILVSRYQDLEDKIKLAEEMELPEGASETDRQVLIRGYRIKQEQIEEAMSSMDRLMDVWDIHSTLECWQPDRKDSVDISSITSDNDHDGGFTQGAMSLAEQLEQKLENLKKGIE